MGYQVTINRHLSYAEGGTSHAYERECRTAQEVIDAVTLASIGYRGERFDRWSLDDVKRLRTIGQQMSVNDGYKGLFIIVTRI